MKDIISTLTINQKNSSRLPIWFMRQAGRYLPEYIKLKEQNRQNGGDFLDMCYNSDIAAQITLQPLQRFDLDAAIVFADILVILDAMGLPVHFIEHHGPVVEKITTTERLQAMQDLNVDNIKISAICNTLSKVKREINANQALIGFAGSPFTVACYAISGGKIIPDEIRKSLIIQDELFGKLMAKLVPNTIQYLLRQIESGATAIQLFESHAGLACSTLDRYESLVIKPNLLIMQAIKAQHPDIPIIFFPKGSGLYYSVVSSIDNYDVLGLDESVPIASMEQLQKSKIIQGNIDNFTVCYGSKQQIKKDIEKIITTASRLIFNLGHGVLQYTPVENIQFAIECARDFYGKLYR